MDEPVINLPNIGKVLANELKKIDILSHSDLCAIGSVEALLKLKIEFNRGCFNTLYAIEGAIQKIRWHDLPLVERKRLKEELQKAIQL